MASTREQGVFACGSRLMAEAQGAVSQCGEGFGAGNRFFKGMHMVVERLYATPTFSPRICWPSFYSCATC
eukprot:1158156-Pelagomonas_calceolata.AAC.1